ncbi:unnamed protein product [Rhizophagus irregularis]|nr:unnamed protein product [Rhizophagus irregularis]
MDSETESITSDEVFIYTEHEENDDVQDSSDNSDTDENTNESDENNSTSDNATSDNATIEEEKVGDSHKKTSGVWQHYDIIEQNSKCKYCRKTYAKSTSTTILWHHYRKYHEKSSSNRAIQSTLKFSTQTSPPHPDEIMRKKTKSLMNWVILDLKPFSVVESESFIDLVKKLDPHYRLPSRHTIKRLIVKEFEQKRDIIRIFLQNLPFKVSLTCDIWSSIKMESFIAITIHYIDSNWKLCHFILDIFSISGSHTGSFIFETISKLLSDMHLENKVIAITTDNGSNMVSGCKKLVEHYNPSNLITELTHYRCAAHVLHWSKSFLSALIPFVKSSSSSSRDSSHIRLITKFGKISA